MAESDYLNLIAQGLKAYHDAGNMTDFDSQVNSVYLGDFDYQKFYSMMAWIGLGKTVAFKNNDSDADWHYNYVKYTSSAHTSDVTTCK